MSADDAARGKPRNPTNVLGTGDIEIQPSDPLTGRVIDSRYLVEQRLGAGGVGVVYAARHVEIKKPVAIKLLHAALGEAEQFRQRFQREALAVSRLSHPACVSVIDFGHIAKLEPPSEDPTLLGAAYLVMEFVRGDVLADRMEARRLTPRDAVTITRGVLSALRHAHGLGIIHRDIKPANVMLAPIGEPEPWVKLLDFGLAKDLDEDSADSRQPLTEAGMVFGTPGYLSPEQAGGARADARSDLYSLGVMLFEMACGRQPFVHSERIQVVRDHLHTPPPRPRLLAPGLSEALEGVILRALAKRPEDRFESADAFSVALAACPEARTTEPIATAPTTSAAVLAPPPARPPSDRLLAWLRARPRVVVGGPALLLAGVLLLFVARLRTPAPPPAPAVDATQPAAPSASGRRHLALATDYQRRLWCSDAIDELERAVRDEPALREDPEVTRIAIGCLRAKTQGKAIRFLVEAIGKTAVPALQQAIATETRADFREGAQRALNALSGARSP